MKKKMTCTVCPVGCELIAETDDSGAVLSVSGNTCKRGEKYATAELTAPVRTLTSTVHITDSDCVRLPVRTDKPIPKERLFDAMKIIKSMKIKAPVTAGTVIADDFIQPGVNLIACCGADRV